MTKSIYGPYPVEFMGPGVHAGIAVELPAELAGKSVLLKVVEADISNSAIGTLIKLGYTYHGGETWKPPLGSDNSKRGKALFEAANPKVNWLNLGLVQQDYWNKIYDQRKFSS